MATKTRSTLLTGVSLAAVGILAPTHALAQIVPVHPHPDPGTYSGTGTVADTIVIGAVGGTDTANTVYVCDDEPGFCGVVAGATAAVDSTSEGEIQQLALIFGTGTVDFQIIATDAEIGAIAGDIAVIQTGISQLAYISEGTADLAADFNGDMLIHAYASGGESALAVVDVGVYQGGFAGDDNNLSVYVGPATASGTTDASLIVAATALASSEAFAEVEFGILQNASGSTADLDVVNHGAIGVGAFASQEGFAGIAYASVDNGIYQGASGATADADIVNFGSIDVSAIANAGGLGGWGDAQILNGIYQEAEGLDASVSLVNDTDASIAVGAFADVSAAFAQAHAQIGATDEFTFTGTGYTFVTNAGGAAINQFANGSTAVAMIDNQGSINVTVEAVANALNGTAEAELDRAILQVAEGSSVSVDLNNSGNIEIHAVARVDAASEGVASAEGGSTWTDAMIHQGAYGASAHAGLLNSGTISAEFVAEATAGTDADASAIAWGVILQDVNAYTAGANLTNDGNISLVADADAIATSSDSADAYAVASGWLAWQNIGGNSAAATFVNNGLMSVHALADATGASGAYAQAYGAGVYQEISASTAVGVMTNNSMIDIDATAVAEGLNVSALATAEDAIYQSVIATDASAAFVNNATVALFASAEATGSATSMTGPSSSVTNYFGSAYARARAFDGINQFVGYQSGTAVASMVNNGLVSLIAMAEATGGVSARAEAYATGAMEQYVEGTDISANLTNNATVSAHASAGANLGLAFAYASGLHQYADLDGTSGMMVVTLDNQGSVDIDATAQVNGDENYGYAHADGIAMQQSAYGSGAITANLYQGGVISVNGMASVTATEGEADVDVAGVAQYVGGSTVSALLSNSGTVSVFATANGVGVGADADANGGLEQFIGAGSGSALLANSGYVLVAADAHSTDTMFANANADAEQGLGQDMEGTSIAGVIANSGTVIASAMAFASASTTTVVGVGETATTDYLGYAYAYAYASAVDQYVGALGAASGTISNSGAIVATAVATANAGDYAEADAYATGINQYVLGTSALAFIYNGGYIAASASASAVGHDDAQAMAYATGVSQYVWGTTGFGSGSISNSGTISAFASAFASAATGPEAGAYATGIDQSVYGNAGAVASLYNSGYVEVGAQATASGDTFGYAVASALGVDQQVGAEFPSPTASWSMNFSNSGTISAHADATLVGDGEARAWAAGYEGRIANGTIDLDNSGLIEVMGHANASSGVANASAVGMMVGAEGSYIDFGTLPGPTDDTFVPDTLSGDIVNSGNIVVAAVASGSLGSTTTPVLTTSGPGTAIASTLTTYTAYSNASAAGILLRGALVDASVTNSGTIMVDAWTANGDAADVGGSAMAYGVLVEGSGPGVTPTTETFVFTNDGGMIQSRVSGDGGA
ncbi:beta strand repeat-containing protein, partial [Sphingomicrobium nitratireducens]|uniref:beta strand repeat-containing protein n=1 Tax=Sphingomicrobium nitratireducens TaxID=2964666 RepID=UPI00223E926A